MRRFAASVALLSFVAADPGDTAYGHWAPDIFGNPSYVFTGGASDAPNALWLMDLLHDPRSDGRSVRLAQILFLSQHSSTSGAHYMHSTVLTAIPHTSNHSHHVNTA
jgi:hypothetical protein